MALTRNQRRLASRLRIGRAACDAHNSALVTARRELVRDNLSRPGRPERTAKGTVASIYSGAANPVGYTRPHGYRRAASECRSVVSNGSAI